MADIAMCSGTGCPKKSTCYRFTAPKALMQWYEEFERKEDGSCDSYWLVKKCGACDGSGVVEYDGMFVTCNVCDGFG